MSLSVELISCDDDRDALSYSQSERDPFVGSPLWGTWQGTGKRCIDVAIAITLLVLLLPLLIVIAISIRLDSPGPILFRQVRLGKDGRPFQFLKFRGMVQDAESRLSELRAFNDADGPIFKMKHDPRVTRVGRILRRTSLDELPQLWNVVRGEMSLVGPRPPIPAETEKYEPWHRYRLRSTPGITGLWQVNGRSDVSFETMVRLDLQYINEWSLWLDMRILFRTLIVVIRCHGAY